jgi:hypothetical protein
MSEGQLPEDDYHRAIRQALSLVRVRWEAFRTEDKQANRKLIEEMLSGWNMGDLVGALVVVGANLAEALCLLEYERGTPDPVEYIRRKLIELHVVE